MIEVRNIQKTFGTFQALKGIDLQVETGELVALLGPSGSGKTSLLRIIAGLEAPDNGNVLFYGQDATLQSVKDRKVGFVFQHYALFKHMSVFENVAFGLNVKTGKDKLSKSEIKGKVSEMLELVQIDWLADRYPSQLSGGQRQRIALARALIIEPKVLLLDEPFGALDAKVRKELRRWLRRLHHDMRITSLFVTHDQEEALEVADRVVIMDHGTIAQVGSPEMVYDYPATPFVYEFLGNVNRISQGSGKGYVRPHDLQVSVSQPSGHSLTAVVEHIIPLGPTVRVMLKQDTGEELEAELGREDYRDLHLSQGQTIFVSPRHVKNFESAAN
jgi:sulfate/thiosulfate transport system ATP-binding protein